MRAAVIICDMWDKHTCPEATRRMRELAPRIDAFVRSARKRDALIIHAPSGTDNTFYAHASGQSIAKVATMVDAPVEIEDQQRARDEAELPVKVTLDNCCACAPKCDCSQRGPWTRQIASIGIEPGDAVTADGQDIWNLFQKYGVSDVFMVGVHLNLCMLSRPFGIRQMVMLGLNVTLVRDLVDILFNPEEPPHDHQGALDLVVAHVEKFWCPSVLSGEVVVQGRALGAYYDEVGYFTKRGLPEVNAWKADALRYGDQCAAIGYLLGFPNYEAVREVLGFSERGDEVPNMPAKEQVLRLAERATRWPERVLTIGEGRGEVALALAYLGIPVVAVEPSIHARRLMIETREKMQFWGAYPMLRNMHLEDYRDFAPTDVLLVEAIEHIPEREFRSAWAWLRPVTKRLVVANWVWAHPLRLDPNIPDHVWEIDDKVYDWLEKGADTVFRQGSHLVVDSA